MSNAATKTVLVTGGAGYIGSHTCKILAQEGYQPVTFDNLSSGHTWAAKWGPLERGDILDRTALDRAIEKYRPSACLHFAALAYVEESISDPGKYYRNNVAGSLTLLEALRDHGVDQFVLSSTCATYGVTDKVPIDETLPQAPINPYGASKLMVERMLADFHAAYRLRSVALRYLMRPERIQMARSARTTIPKRTWCRSFLMLPSETAKPSRSSEPTTRHPMEHAFVTIST